MKSFNLFAFILVVLLPFSIVSYNKTCSIDSHPVNTSFPDYGTLSWLIYPMSNNLFLNIYYQKVPLYFERRNQSYYTHHQYGNFQYHKKVTQIIGRRSKRTKKYMLARATKTGEDVQPFHYWKSPEVIASYSKAEIKNGVKKSDINSYWDPDALNYLYDEGYTINFPSIHMYLHKPFLFELLIKHLGVYPKLNLYVTPKRNKGFKKHFDSHDVYILQINGSKHWKVYSKININYPVTDWSDKKLSKVRPKLKKPIIDVILHEGDSLYIPRGYIHEAECDQIGSTHITIGFMTMKKIDLIYISIREFNYLSADQLKQLKNYCIQITKKSDDLRQSIIDHFCVNDRQCNEPNDAIIELYTNVVNDFFLNVIGHKIPILIKNIQNILMKGYQYRKKIMKKLSRRISNLSKLRPITHLMQEKRKSVEIVRKNKNGGSRGGGGGKIEK
jgi:hypothetical protein